MGVTKWAGLGDTAFTYGSLFVAPNFFSEEFAPVGSLEAGCRLGVFSRSTFLKAGKNSPS